MRTINQFREEQAVKDDVMVVSESVRVQLMREGQSLARVTQWEEREDQ